MELYYGWPVTYQAEWWRSEDPDLAKHLLQSAPFCHPAGQMTLQARSWGIPAAVADVAFGGAVVFTLALAVESIIGRFRPGIVVVGLIVAFLIMGAVLAVADRIEEHV